MTFTSGKQDPDSSLSLSGYSLEKSTKGPWQWSVQASDKSGWFQCPTRVVNWGSSILNRILFSHVWSILKQPIYNFPVFWWSNPHFEGLRSGEIDVRWSGLAMLRRSSWKNSGGSTLSHVCISRWGPSPPKYEHTKNIKEQHVWNRKPNRLYTRVGCYIVLLYISEWSTAINFTVRSANQIPQFCLGNPIESDRGW